MLTTEIQKSPFWSASVSSVAETLQTDEQNGISEEEAKKRLGIFGSNVIEKPHRAPGLMIFLRQLKSPLIVILTVAGFVTLAIDHYRDSAFIFAAVVLNAILGFYQEYKAEKALAKLKTYLRQRSRVVRGGKEREVDAADLVPGDLIRLAQGDRAPADARLSFVNDMQIDEAVLTGESLPVAKSVEPVSASAVLAEQHSMVFAGTLVTQGVATAIICRTDFSTEIGKIASMVSEARTEETPLQSEIRRFSVWISGALGLLTLVVFGAGIALGHPWVEVFIISVAIAVSAVPEGLPVAMTVILAIGVQRMARRKGVVRKLVAAEALGSATLILTDKTGTLTMAKMELGQVLPFGGEKKEKLLEKALLNTNVLIEEKRGSPADWRMNGRTIEVSLVRSLALQGMDVQKIKNKASILSSLPFNAVNKFSASLVKDGDKRYLVFLGAPDILVSHSSMSAKEKKEALEKIGKLAAAGELVIGVATRKAPAKKDFSFAKDLEVNRLEFKGLLTLKDPVRPSVKAAIRDVERAGIKVVIMTGDHRGTAEAVAREVGIPVPPGGVLEASELRGLPDEELQNVLPGLRVIARVSPLDKLRIVKALQAQGQVVAMTGDGVNDAPSIKQADIGVAMGSGTEVARDVADLVLLDDNFETIAAAVEEGRQIMDNIRKVLVYLLSNVTGSLLLIGGALVAGIALPLNALQILWVNFFSDSFPAVAFAFEGNIDGLGDRSAGKKRRLFEPVMKFLTLGIGTITSALLFILYWVLLKYGFSEDLVRTFIFACFGTYTLFLAFSVRSLEKSIFEYSPFTNTYLVGAAGIGVVLMVVAVYLPVLQSLFGTVSLPLPWALAVMVVGILNIAAVEFGKWLFRKKPSRVETAAA